MKMRLFAVTALLACSACQPQFTAEDRRMLTEAHTWAREAKDQSVMAAQEAQRAAQAAAAAQQNAADAAAAAKQAGEKSDRIYRRAQEK